MDKIEEIDNAIKIIKDSGMTLKEVKQYVKDRKRKEQEIQDEEDLKWYEDLKSKINSIV